MTEDKNEKRVSMICKQLQAAQQKGQCRASRSAVKMDGNEFGGFIGRGDIEFQCLKRQMKQQFNFILRPNQGIMEILFTDE